LSLEFNKLIKRKLVSRNRVWFICCY